MSDTSVTTGSSASLDVGLLREYATLKLQRDVLDRELGVIKSKLVKYEEPVRNALIDSGVSKLPVTIDAFSFSFEEELPSQRVSVHLWTQIRGRRSKHIDIPTVAAALQAAGLGEFCQGTYNWQKVDEYVREHVKAELSEDRSIEDAIATLPSELSSVLDVYKHVEARCSKA